MESNKTENDVPPAPESWKDLPGEVVMRFEADPARAQDTYGFEWQVKKLEAGKHYELKEGQTRRDYHEASTPYRMCVYAGESAEEAVAALMKGMSLLSREGAINPSNPHAIGAPPIQHAISILTERLLWAVDQRQNHLVMGGYADSPGNIWPSPYAGARYAADDKQKPEESQDPAAKLAARRAQEEAFNEQMVKTVARDNEVVSALATAIAALARVKDI